MSRELKIKAAQAAFEFVKDGMKLGIGTGSTADEFIRILGKQVGKGLTVTGVPTSERSAALCREVGVPLTTLDETPELDLTVDGADEADRDLTLIKGGGGALLREKIVAAASADMVVIADDSKLVDVLGAFPLPVEVTPFGLGATHRAIEKAAESLGLSGPVELRKGDGKPYLTDGGHFIVDASFGRIPDAKALSSALLEIPGVVQHGLFIGLASTLVLAGEGGITLLRR
ncbi:ribose-5-phosphate isomerase RpiA [Salaquimonas pukyongi]|uniref:ribose-5-phosphate isomerase RpiA n=1 Tax=Salaquimonas pukyongi TaxID=2712698 RepID=UPI00096BB982|nr:ribose-5-phosphate isomerase RpiA [Salaquimonas pukyongi]